MRILSLRACRGEFGILLGGLQIFSNAYTTGEGANHFSILPMVKTFGQEGMTQCPTQYAHNRVMKIWCIYVPDGRKLLQFIIMIPGARRSSGQMRVMRVEALSLQTETFP